MTLPLAREPQALRPPAPLPGGTRAAPDWIMAVPGAVLAAALDRRLQPRDLSVYVALCAELDVLDHRPIKHAWLARRVALSRRGVLRTLDHLLT